MLFLEERFPENISYGSIGGPQYYTSIITSNNGHEQRSANWNKSRIKYNLTNGIKTVDDLETVLNFFHLCQGRAVGFRFKDWLDYSATNQELGVGDGTKTRFNFVKKYQVNNNYIYRTLSKIVENSIIIYQNNIETNENFTINLNEGYIDFATPPSQNTTISADFEFDIPVRFDSDELQVSIETNHLYRVENIELLEIK